MEKRLCDPGRPPLGCAFLIAGHGLPRTWCRKDGVHQVQVPWAREGSGFTLMMEALMMLLSAEMPVDAMADLLDEHDTRLLASVDALCGASTR